MEEEPAGFSREGLRNSGIAVGVLGLGYCCLIEAMQKTLEYNQPWVNTVQILCLLGFGGLLASIFLVSRQLPSK